MTERLLKLVGPAHVLGGLVLFASGFVAPLQRLLQSAIPVSDTFVWSPFFAAVLGPTIASWGLLFGALITQFYKAPAHGIWQSLLFAVLIWAPLDSALCLRFGLYGGVVINVAVAIAVVVLLLQARSEIK